MSEWKTYKLGELVEVQNGFAFKANDFSDKGIPVIKIKNIISPRISFQDCEYYEGILDKRLEQFIIRKGDILISMTGSHVNQIASAVGKVGKYQFDYPALVNQRVGKLFSKNENLLNQDYFYYHISRFETQVDLASSAGGSANQANISPSQIKSLEITIPDLATQTQIAAILTSLDDKIELNLQMNQTLEAMAQALFKEWFVNFNFPDHDSLDEKEGLNHDSLDLLDEKEGLNHDSLDEQEGLNHDSLDLLDEKDSEKKKSKEKNQANQDNPQNQGSDNLPKGWRMGKLGEEFNLTMGQSPKGETLNQENEGMIFYQGRTDFGFRFPSNRIYTTEPNRIANKLDTLVCVRAPVGDINMAIEKCCIGRGLSAVMHKSNAYSYTYYLMNNIEPIFKGFESEGTVFGSLNKNNFENIEVVVPNKQLLKDFEKVINPIDEKILNNSLQIQTLTQTRDALLPKLMSGRLNLDFLDGQDSKDFKKSNQGNQENHKNQGSDK